MSHDTTTTIIGALGAAVTAATPVLNAVQGASLQQQDYLQLAMAIVFAVLGFFTNRKPAEVQS